MIIYKIILYDIDEIFLCEILVIIHVIPVIHCLWFWSKRLMITSILIIDIYIYFSKLYNIAKCLYFYFSLLLSITVSRERSFLRRTKRKVPFKQHLWMKQLPLQKRNYMYLLNWERENLRGIHIFVFLAIKALLCLHIHL